MLQLWRLRMRRRRRRRSFSRRRGMLVGRRGRRRLDLGRPARHAAELGRRNGLFGDVHRVLGDVRGLVRALDRVGCGAGDPAPGQGSNDDDKQRRRAGRQDRAVDHGRRLVRREHDSHRVLRGLRRGPRRVRRRFRFDFVQASGQLVALVGRDQRFHLEDRLVPVLIVIDPYKRPHHIILAHAHQGATPKFPLVTASPPPLVVEPQAVERPPPRRIVAHPRGHAA